ncbi:MAG: exonuclease SbcCD subunit D [Acidimicrobiia bacterium]
MRSWPRRDRSKHTRTSQRSPTLAIVRILHTSDWHLGRTFGPISLIDDQAAFIDWLVELCVDQRVDLVVIAGDLYDRAIADGGRRTVPVRRTTAAGNRGEGGGHQRQPRRRRPGGELRRAARLQRAVHPGRVWTHR